MTLVDRLRHFARETPDAPAFTITVAASGVHHLSYAELGVRVRGFANALEARGVGAGDRVPLALTTTPELVALIFAAQSLHAWPMVVNPSLPAPTIARRAQQVQAKLVVDAALAGALADEARAADPAQEPRAWATRGAPDDIAFLQLTSGTSGESRAAAITNAQLTSYLESSMWQLELTTGDILVGWVPLHHDLGIVRFVFTTVHYGLHAHLLPPALSSLRPWLRTISDTRAKVTAAPDFAYRIATRSVSPDGLDLSCLLTASNGGEPVRASTITDFEARFGCPGAIRPGYGLAEATLSAAAVFRGDPIKVDARGTVSCGRVIPSVEARIVNEGVACAPGEPGDIELRGPAVFAGYFDPALPERFDRSAFTDDGWLRTGDAGYFDAAGEVFVLGRKRAMVKQAGSLIAPREVEEVVDRLPDVRLSVAIGLANAWDGAEELAVVIETRGDPAPGLADAVRAAVRAEVGVTPGRVLFVPPRTIPITHNGKVRHAVTRELIERMEL